ncbi:MAG: transcriptional repressor [Planctomycetes bacterium]|nr:transcriptional repressor [Planctomycetota bacterium]
MGKRSKDFSEERARLETVCRTRGLPLTVQRRIVLQAILGRTDHPTADAVFERVRAGHPEIARATIYRTLEKLVEFGVIAKVAHPGASIRYDPNVGRHHHLVCVKCGGMLDFEDAGLDGIPLPEGRVHGFEIADYSIHFRGICKECRKGRAGGLPKRAKRKKQAEEKANGRRSKREEKG